MNWTTLTNSEQVKTISESEGYTIIYKHSPRCMTSLMAYRQLKGEVLGASGNDTPLYIVDVIENRSESQLVAHTFAVEHESPQLLVIRNGKSIYDTSHENVSLKSALERIV